MRIAGVITASPEPAASCPNATPAVAAVDELSEEGWARLGFEVLDGPVPASSALDACPTTTTCTASPNCEDTNVCRTINTCPENVVRSFSCQSPGL